MGCLLCGSDGKESVCNARDLGSIPGSGRSPGKEWQPTLVLSPGKSQGWRSLVAAVHGVAKSQTQLSNSAQHTAPITAPESFLEKAMAPHSSTLGWKIPWMEEPGGLQSIGHISLLKNPSSPLFKLINWRIITFQYCDGFCHTAT